jgi:uncharacterized protein (TIGR02271 family)
MNWIGAAITDRAGRRYGRLDDVFVDRASGQPGFGIVSLGDHGEQGRVAVPLDGAERRDDGTLVLGVDADRVLGAPRVQRDVDAIPTQTGELIREHFGLRPSRDGAADLSERDDTRFADGEAAEVIRSEEELSVSTRTEATERVRVRKQVIMEDVTVTVTLRREELVIEREPLEAGAVPAPADFPVPEAGSEIEFVLHAEEPVVAKRVVPVERVRVHREITSDDQHVTDTVRKELVDVDELPLTREDPLR